MAEWLGRFDDEEILTEFGKCKPATFIPKIPSEIFIMPVAEVPPPPAPPASQQGRRPSSKNYGIEETRHLFAILTTIVPIGPDEWQRVCDEHNLNYPGRDLNSIKRRYATLYRKQMPTGNPNMPWEVREAKTIKRLIGEKAMMGDGQEHFDLQQGFGNNNPAPAPTLPARDPTPTPLVLTEASRARNNIEPRNLEPRSTVTNSKRSYNRSGTASDILEAMSLSLVMQENDRVERREQSKAMVEAFTKAAAGLAEIFAPKKKRRKTKRTSAEASALAKRTGLDDSDSSDSDSDSDLDLDNLIR